jgi:hypothetical protein
VGHASRSSGLLRLKASRARILQSALKIGGGATRMVHMVSSWKLRRGQVEVGRVDVTGCIGPCYPCFIIFFVLGRRGNLVF